MSRWSELAKKLKDIISAERESESSDNASTIKKISSIVGKAMEARRRAKARARGAPPVEDFAWFDPRTYAEQLRDLAEQQREEDGYPIETLGRDATYDPELWAEVQSREVLVDSSNVYSYFWEQEKQSSGILYVTFLDWEPGMKSEDRAGPGSTYAYYDVSNVVFQAFEAEARSTPGGAVWDMLRVRGTIHGHQYRYKLVQVAGEYVPRKATAKGFAERTLVAPGMRGKYRRATFKRSEMGNKTAEQFFKRSTLAPTAGMVRRGQPNRARPNRGGNLFDSE